MRRTRSGFGRFFTLMIFVAAVMLSHCAAANGQKTPAIIAALTPGLVYEPAYDGLRDGLEKLGYRDNREVRYIVEDTRGSLERLSARAAALAAAKPDVLFAVTTSHALAAKQATRIIPIVFAVVADPVRSDLVAGFGSSKNNVTGVATYGAHLSGKRLELLKEMAPHVNRVLAVVPVNESISLVSFKDLEESAKKLRLQIVRRNVTGKETLAHVMREKWAGLVDAVYSLPSVLVASSMEAIIEKTKKERLPLIGLDAAHTRMGALASYSGDYREYGSQCAKLVAKVLGGTKPSDIPVETPDRLLLAVNINTAKAIGIRVTQNVLVRTDRLVE